MRQSFLCIVVSILLVASPGIRAADLPLIFPVPQSQELTSEKFSLDKDVSIVVPMNASPKDLSLASMLVEELSDQYGLSLTIEKRSDIPANRRVVVMGSISNPLIMKYIAAHQLALSKTNPGTEGYILEAGNNMIIIGGSDDAGTFYGFQSLRQLIRAGNGKVVQGIHIKDRPALAIRAVRIFVPGPENITFFKRFMKNFLALYKFNKVVMEFNCMRLDRHPEVNTGWQAFARYMTYSRSTETLGKHGETKNSSHYDAGDGFILEKDAVRDLVNCANASYLEVIPEIPSLSHVYYLLANHPELAEYPGDKWPDTYCPSNPASYKLMFDVFDEYIDVLKPRMVHVGHDEWRGAPIDVCPLCKGKDYSELYAADVNKIHDYLARKGIKMAMWGDFLLEDVRGKGPQDKVATTGLKYKLPGALPPALVKKSIPKDILIFNWFWDGKENNKDRQLAGMGFSQLYGNLDPTIANWETRTHQMDIAGGAPSAWAATNEYSFGKDLMLDFLGCANMLWSGKAMNRANLAAVVWQRIPDIRSGLHDKLPPSEDGNQSEPIDISSQFNFPAAVNGMGPGAKDLASGDIHHRSVVFRLPARNDNGNTAIVVGAQGEGSNPFASEVSGIPINEDVTSLVFLHACAKPAGNPKSYFNIPDVFDSPDLLGWYEIVYEDGFKAIVPIQYGVNILEWNARTRQQSVATDSALQDVPYCYQADAVDCSKEKNGLATAFAFEWTNPRLGKIVKTVNFHGSTGYQSLKQEFERPQFTPMPANAVLLLAVSKVKKQDRIQPF